MDEIDIAPEIVRLARQRCRITGIPLALELARLVAQEAIICLDVNEGFLLAESEAASTQDGLVAAFGVNDIVVNTHRIDVRPVGPDGRVRIPEWMCSSQYLSTGTLAVHLHGTGGQVVDLISARRWQQEGTACEPGMVSIALESKDFNLAQALEQLTPQPAPSCLAPPSLQAVTALLADCASTSPREAAKLIDQVLASPQVWAHMDEIAHLWSRSSISKVLRASALWSRRIDEIASLVAPKFQRLTVKDIRRIVARTGESFGGQAESPLFRKSLVAALTRAELSGSLGGAMLRKAILIAEEVLSGRGERDAIKVFVHNQVTLELASAIKAGRQELAGFFEASAEEIAMAFQQLALQPVYATHSQDPHSGIQAVNEALKLLAAAELAKSLQELEDKLAHL